MSRNGHPNGHWAELPPLIGTSLAIRTARDLIARYATTTLPVLIIGPTGTGKELVARHVHAQSGRRGRFVPVNCAALPREMAESLLFGHRRGAFSGAVESRRGHFEFAHGGTLFLDEILCLSLDGQAKLLRALDTGEIQPLGEEGEHFVDVRVVAAAQEGVWASIGSAFRADVYQRIAGILVMLPPLAERPQDIVPIARYLTEPAGRSLDTDAERELERHSWPGNVRELRQVIERAGRLVQNGTLSAAAVGEAIALGAPLGGGRSAILTRSRRRRPTREEVLAACERSDWQAGSAAKTLGVGRTTLFKLLREYGLALKRPSDSQFTSSPAN